MHVIEYVVKASLSFIIKSYLYYQNKFSEISIDFYKCFSILTILMIY